MIGAVWNDEAIARNGLLSAESQPVQRQWCSLDYALIGERSVAVRLGEFVNSLDVLRVYLHLHYILTLRKSP